MAITSPIPSQVPVFTFPKNPVQLLMAEPVIPTGQTPPNVNDVIQWNQLFTFLKNDLTKLATSSQKRANVINGVQKILFVLSLGAIIASGFLSVSAFCAVTVVALAANRYTAYKKKQCLKLAKTANNNLAAATGYQTAIQKPEFINWITTKIPTLLNKPIDAPNMNAIIYTFCRDIQQVQYHAEMQQTLLAWHQQWAQHPVNAFHPLSMPGHSAPINKMPVTDLNAWNNYVHVETIQVKNREAASKVTCNFVCNRNKKKIRNMLQFQDALFKVFVVALKDQAFPKWMQQHKLDDRPLLPLEFSYCAQIFTLDQDRTNRTANLVKKTINNLTNPQQPAVTRV